MKKIIIIRINNFIYYYVLCRHIEGIGSIRAKQTFDGMLQTLENWQSNYTDLEIRRHVHRKILNNQVGIYE